MFSYQLLNKVSLMTTMLGSGPSTCHYPHLNWAGLHVPISIRLVGTEAGKSWQLIGQSFSPKKACFWFSKRPCLKGKKNRGRHLMSYFSLHICIQAYVHLHTTTLILKLLLEIIPPKSQNINSTFRPKKYKLYHNHHQLRKKGKKILTCSCSQSTL